MRIFFSHPISTYCSPVEDRALETLLSQFEEVINPSDRSTQERCGSDMEKWAALARTGDALAFLPFADGRIGAGVIKEVGSALEAGLPVFVMDTQGKSMRQVTDWPKGFDLMSIEQTREVIGAFRKARADMGLPILPTRETPYVRKPRSPRP